MSDSTVPHTAAHALVPLKDLVEAKTRLSGLLRPAERRALAQAMAEDVLAVLSRHPSIAAVTLVSDDPGAQMLAKKYGAQHWLESELGCVGLNPVIAKATEKITATFEGSIVVLHADIPLLSQQEISAVLARQALSQGVVVGCDAAQIGTNLLAFDSRCVPQFRFGHRSCAAHEQWAREQGVPVTLMREAGIALDIDEPRDLSTLLEQLPGHSASETASLLLRSKLGARLSLALDNRNGLEQAAANAEFNSSSLGHIALAPSDTQETKSGL